MSENYYSYQYKESHQNSRLNITTTANGGVGIGLPLATDPIGPASSYCERCKELVYPLEGLVPIMNVRYHKKCFKCSVCSTHLDLKTYHTNLVDLNDKRIYCIAHKPKDSKPLNSLYSTTSNRSRSKSPTLAHNTYEYGAHSAISSNHSHSGSSLSSSTYHNDNLPSSVHTGVQYELPVTFQNDTHHHHRHGSANDAGSLVEKVLIDGRHNSSSNNAMTMNDAASILKNEIGWKDDVFTPSSNTPSVSDSGNYAVHHKENKEKTYHRKEVGADSVTNLDRKEQENTYKYESANQTASSVSKTVDQVTHTVIGAAAGDQRYSNGTGVYVNPSGNQVTAGPAQHQLTHSNSGTSLNNSVNSSQTINSNFNANNSSNVNYTGSAYNSANRNDNYATNALINAVADDVHRHDSNRHVSASSAHDSVINHPIIPAGTGAGAITINPNIKLPNIGNLNIDPVPGGSVFIQEKNASQQHSSSQTIINGGAADPHVVNTGNVTSITKIDQSSSSSEHQVKIVSNGSGVNISGAGINISGPTNPSHPSIEYHDKNQIGNITDIVPMNPPVRIPTVKPREPAFEQQDDIIGTNKGFGTIKLTVFYCDQQNRLSVTVHEAKNLIKLDKKGKSDPFARVYLLPDKKKLTKKKTKIVKDQLNPVWEETFDYQVSLAEASSKDLLVNIKDDKGLFEKQETQFMGEVLLDLRKVEMRKPFTRWFWLQPKTRESELLMNSDNNTLVL